MILISIFLKGNSSLLYHCRRRHLGLWEAANLEDDFEEVFQHFGSLLYDLCPLVHNHRQHVKMLVMLLLVGLKFSDDKV